MPTQKGRASQGGSQKASARTPEKNDSGFSQAPTDAPILGDRGEYVCGGCNHEADYAYRIDRYTKKPTWFVGNSFSTRCPKKGECLKLHCEWLAELGIEVTPEQLLTDPRPALLAAGANANRDDRPPPPLPGDGTISGWHSALLSYPLEPLEYLLDRGISIEVVQRYEIGWDRDRQRLIFPMRGGLLKTRPALRKGQMTCWPGKDRPWPLYPEVPRDDKYVLLVAGELDALAGLAAGLPAVSVTLGAGTWRDAWTQELKDAGVPVVVAFDNNETALARKRASELRAAGVRARHLDLRTLGLKTAKGDLSDYLNSGGDPKRIKPPGRRTK
jgi:hypothetical protein